MPRPLTVLRVALAAFLVYGSIALLLTHPPPPLFALAAAEAAAALLLAIPRTLLAGAIGLSVVLAVAFVHHGGTEPLFVLYAVTIWAIVLERRRG